MIPLFCFFPSLAAKQKKKETAKGRLFFSVADFAAAHGGK